MPYCLMVRHGRTAANASGTLAGWTPGVGLDDHGVAAARALGQRLATLPIRFAAVSPLQRCQETYTALADAASWADTVRRQDVDDLGECRYGAWTGRSLGELAAEPLWQTVQQHPSRARFPESPDYPAESIAAMQARAVAAVRGIDALVEAEHGASAAWLLVSHGDVIKALLADAAGTHLDLFQRISVGPASLSVVNYTATRPFVVKVNDTGADLAGLVPEPSAAPTAAGSANGDAVVGGGA